MAIKDRDLIDYPQLYKGETISQPEQKEFEPRPVLKTDSVLLEITERCYTNCGWCYKCQNVSGNGEHVPLDLIKKRIDWADHFTDAEELVLLGGEALLHPDFIDIVKYAKSSGYKINLITSGKIAPTNEIEQHNLDYAFSLYEKNEISFELSLQPNRNNQDYLVFFNRIKESAPKRKVYLEQKKASLSATNPDDPQIAEINEALIGRDLFSTVTMDASFAQDKEKFTRLWEFILRDCMGYNFETTTTTEKNIPIAQIIDEQFTIFQKHFQPFESSATYSFILTASDPLSLQIRMWGQSRIIPNDWEIVNQRRYNTSSVEATKGWEENELVCPAMTSETDPDKKTVDLESIVIRTDGECTFALPNCISGLSGFCNTDAHNDVDAIYDAASHSLSRRRSNIIFIKSQGILSELDKCKLDSAFPTTDEGKAKVCPSCPMDKSCHVCHNTLEEWTI